ncbi:hypothetical protein BH09ACT12_BH09ACT12_28620 [soil metagenome]
MSASHVFAHRVDVDGVYHREVRLEDDGGLTIIGHDVGSGAMGGAEYEFERRIDPAQLRRFVAAIEVPGDPREVLELLAAEFASSVELELRLETEGVATTFWSRVG